MCHMEPVYNRKPKSLAVKMEKCPKCKHFGCQINQGRWWCELGLNMDSEKCEACDTTLYDKAVITVTPQPEKENYVNWYLYKNQNYEQ